MPPRAESNKDIPSNVYRAARGYMVEFHRRPKGGRKWRRYRSFVSYKKPNALGLAVAKREEMLRFFGKRSFVNRKAYSNTGLVGITEYKRRKCFLVSYRLESGKPMRCGYSYGHIRSREEALKLAYGHRLLAVNRRAKKEGFVQDDGLLENN